MQQSFDCSTKVLVWNVKTMTLLFGGALCYEPLHSPHIESINNHRQRGYGKFEWECVMSGINLCILNQIIKYFIITYIVYRCTAQESFSAKCALEKMGYDIINIKTYLNNNNQKICEFAIKNLWLTTQEIIDRGPYDADSIDEYVEGACEYYFGMQWNENYVHKLHEFMNHCKIAYNNRIKKGIKEGWIECDEDEKCREKFFNKLNEKYPDNDEDTNNIQLNDK